MAEQDTEKAQAADQEPSGQAEGTQAEEKVEGKGEEKAKPFTPEQEQYIGSWMGRIIKKQFDENVLPHIRQPQEVTHTATNPDDAMKAFNEKVQEKLFSGDAVGAMDMVMNLKDRARQNLTQNQNMNLMRGLVTYSDKAYYEDIQPEMQKIAKERVAEGYPVDAALKTAYAEAKASFLENKLGGGDGDTKGLGLTGGGKQPPRGNKPVKLTPEFERACKRDIADGLYKNQEEWVKGLSPKVKERIGL